MALDLTQCNNMEFGEMEMPTYCENIHRPIVFDGVVSDIVDGIVIVKSKVEDNMFMKDNEITITIHGEIECDVGDRIRTIEGGKFEIIKKDEQ